MAGDLRQYRLLARPGCHGPQILAIGHRTVLTSGEVPRPEQLCQINSTNYRHT
jgi:hypothetical protein